MATNSQLRLSSRVSSSSNYRCRKKNGSRMDTSLPTSLFTAEYSDLLALLQISSLFSAEKQFLTLIGFQPNFPLMVCFTHGSSPLISSSTVSAFPCVVRSWSPAVQTLKYRLRSFTGINLQGSLGGWESRGQASCIY